MADQPRNQAAASTSNNNDSAAVLRAELERELKNKKQCSYQPYQCTQLTLDGYKYCMKHILNDKNAPFKQCAFVYQSNGKRCNLPAPKYDKKDSGYCHEHALKGTLARNRQNSKHPPPHTAEVLLHSLTHYVKRPRSRAITEEVLHGSQDEPELKCTKSVDPFVDLDASSVLSERYNEILDLCSDSESDVEPSTFSNVWRDYHEDSSDNESIDSEEEDPLKHANVYTAEEVTRITKEKLVQLQSLYVEQYRHLQHLLREKKRKYLHSLKREKETCCNIANQVRDNPKEQRMYKKLKYYNKYHRAFGVDAILSKRVQLLRNKMSDGSSAKPHHVNRCIFTEGGVKCAQKVLPCAKHCRKHILEDPHQVLFKACGKMNDDVECNTPIEALFDDSRCRLHMEIPLIRSYHQPRKESESDAEGSLDLGQHYNLPSNDHVKTELIDYSMPPELPKMEKLPSILFEEGPENSQRSEDNFDNSISCDTKENVDEKPVENENISEDNNLVQEVSKTVELEKENEEKKSDNVENEVKIEEPEYVEKNTDGIEKNGENVQESVEIKAEDGEGGSENLEIVKESESCENKQEEVVENSDMNVESEIVENTESDVVKDEMKMDVDEN